MAFVRAPAITGLAFFALLGSAAVLLSSGCSKRSAQGGPVELKLLATTEKRAWIQGAVERFNKKKPRLSDRGLVRASIEFVPSTLLAGRADDEQTAAHAVLPPASWMLDAANRKSVSEGVEKLFLTPGACIARTPLVFVAYRSVAEAMGWTGSGLGWRELAALSAEPQFYKPPQSGMPFFLSYPDPETSHTGLMTLLSLGCVARGGAPLKEARDLDSPAVAAMFASFESSLPCFFPSPEAVLATMSETSPRHLTVGVAFEHQVAGLRENKTREPIVAIPPREGTWIADHPFAIINRKWVTPRHVDAARLLLEHFLSDDEQGAAEKLGIRPAGRSPRREAPILPPEGLDPAEPQPLEITPSELIAQRALEVWRGVRKPRVILLLLDASSSMAARNPARIDLAKDLIRRIPGKLLDRDTLSLIVAGSPPQWVIPPAPPGKFAEQIDGVLEKIRPGGPTALHDTIRSILRHIEKSKPIRSPVSLLIFSDGTDDSSKTSFRAIYEDLGDFIGDGSLFRVFGFSLNGIHGFDAMRRFALATGGRVFEPAPGTIDAAASEAAGSF